MHGEKSCPTGVAEDVVGEDAPVDDAALERALKVVTGRAVVAVSDVDIPEFGSKVSWLIIAWRTRTR